MSPVNQPHDPAFPHLETVAIRGDLAAEVRRIAKVRKLPLVAHAERGLVAQAAAKAPLSASFEGCLAESDLEKGMMQARR